MIFTKREQRKLWAVWGIFSLFLYLLLCKIFNSYSELFHFSTILLFVPGSSSKQDIRVLMVYCPLLVLGQTSLCCSIIGLESDGFLQTVKVSFPPSSLGVLDTLSQGCGYTDPISWCSPAPGGGATPYTLHLPATHAHIPTLLRCLGLSPWQFSLKQWLMPVYHRRPNHSHGG